MGAISAQVRLFCIAQLLPARRDEIYHRFENRKLLRLSGIRPDENLENGNGKIAFQKTRSDNLGCSPEMQ